MLNESITTTNKNVETTIKKETIEMAKKVTVIFKKEDCAKVKNDVNVISLFYDAVPAHMLTPNAVTTAAIRALDLKSKNFRSSATAIYSKQLEQYNDAAFDCLNGKTVMVGYAVMNALIQKLVALGFEVATELPTVQKIDRWGEGQPHGYEKYFKGSYAAQIVSGSLTESNLSVRGKGMEDMYQVNCALCDGDKLIATAYTYVRAGSIGSAKRVVEIVFGEHYNANIKACFKNDLVEKPGIFTIKDTEKARKAVTAARKNNGVMYTKAAREEQQSVQQIATLETELAKRDSRITDLETAVAKLQKVVAALTDGKTVVQKPENDPEPEDPKPSSTPAGDEDNWDDDDWETPAHCEDVLMNPDAVKQETTLELNDNPEPKDPPSEPAVSTKDEEEDWSNLDDISTPGYHEDSMMNPNAKPAPAAAIVENNVKQDQDTTPVETADTPAADNATSDKQVYDISSADITLDEESSTLIASFYSFIDISMPSKAVLDYKEEVKKFETERDRRYVMLIAHAHALGCTLEELKGAVKKFRPQGLKIKGISVKNDGKMYVLANKCGPGLAWFEIAKDNGVIKILKDSFIKRTIE